MFSRCCKTMSITIQPHKSKKAPTKKLPITAIYTYLGVLVGGFLPLLGHGLRLGLGEQMDHVEDGEGGQGQLSDLPENTHALALGRNRAGAVRTESNPVG